MNARMPWSEAIHAATCEQAERRGWLAGYRYALRWTRMTLAGAFLLGFALGAVLVSVTGGAVEWWLQ